MSGKTLCVAAIFSVVLCAPATAQTPSPQKLREAYDVAIKCFIADGYAAGNRQKSGDTKREQYYDRMGKIAAAAGVKLGKALGYPDRQFVDDSWAMKDTEIPKYTRQPDYFSQIATTCKAYGFM